jgi:hypothetical protein
VAIRNSNSEIRSLTEGEPPLPAANAWLRLYQAVRRLLATDDGVTVLRHLQTMVRHGETVLHPGQPDRTAFHLGQQDVVNWLVNVRDLTAAQMAELARTPPPAPAANGVEPMWQTRPTGADDFLFPRKERTNHVTD